MEDESEKRFHSIMDKLFHSPKPKPTPKSNSSSSSSSRGKKPLNALTIMDSNSRGGALRFQTASDKSLQQAPLCRPWERADLLKRLATFKSMTWFGKPKVINAVNCARRGWINVDMDIIACESCGARLLFSNPSSWTQQQVEKAALVFSLKLDSGHKLLCPWIDNACDEKLAQFPPMPAQVLIEGYRERSSALLQLSALPIISSSTMDKMRSPQLEHFIRQSSTLECGDGSADTFRPAYLGNECEAVSANLYYQALKLISLCGWEPRSLPYMVDCMNLSNKSAKDATHLNPSHTNGQDIHVYSTSINGITEVNELTKAEGGLQSDPHSVVLDCKLCGATVGLWAFSTVARPAELFRVVGYSEVGGENDSEATGPPQTHLSNENRGDSSQGAVNAAPNGATSSKDRSSTLNTTIAGGPPPAKQNFKATISLPIVGQNLRARFSSDSNFRDHVCVSIQSDSVSNNTFQKGKDHIEDTHNGQVQAEGTGLLKRKRHDDGHCDSTSDDQLPNSNTDVIIKDCALTKETDSQMSLDDRNATEQGLFPETGTHDSILRNTVESAQNVAYMSGQNHELSQNEEYVGAVDQAVRGSEEFLVSGTSMAPLGAEFPVRNGETTENDSSMIVAADDCNLLPLVDNIIPPEEISLASHQESSRVASSMEASLNFDNTSKIQTREGSSLVHNTSNTQTTCLESDVIEETAQIPVNNEMACDIAKDLRKQPSHKDMEFDAIRQHRHFCPWISSTGNAAPGWQQTLSAILRQKEGSNPLPMESPSSTSMIEVDDPIASVRKLFMSPLAKKIKSTHNPG